MNVLVYSLRSEYCVQLIDFIKGNDLHNSLVKFHDVNKSGVPNGIQRVPSLITSDGKILIGGEIKDYLETFLSSEPNGIGNGGGTYDLDGADGDNFYSLDSFGETLAPK